MSELTTTHVTGKFVSESKFQENPSAFIPHILNPNRQALDALITKPEVERKLLIRLQKKAATYAQDVVADSVPNGNAPHNGNGNKIDVDGVVDLYESYIIPLTKEVEVGNNMVIMPPPLTPEQVDYLLRRLDGLSQEEIDKLNARGSS